jgi:hypothetical protein
VLSTDELQRCQWRRGALGQQRLVSFGLLRLLLIVDRAEQSPLGKKPRVTAEIVNWINVVVRCTFPSASGILSSD